MYRPGWTLFPLIALLAGCYSHAPVRPADAPAGASVRARVSATQAEALGALLGREDRVLHGRVVGPGDGGSLLLQVPAAGSGAGTRLEQRVALPPGEIVELEVRTLDRLRTGGLVGALVLAGGAILFQQFSDEAEADPPSAPKPGGSDQAIFAFRWRW